MKALRTCGVEQLESRAMLAAFGPPGGVHELHFAGHEPRYSDFGRAPAHFDAGDWGGPLRFRGFDSRPPTPELQVVIQIIILSPPVVIVPSRAPAVSSPQMFAVFAASPSADDRGEGEGSSTPLRTGVQRPPANFLPIGPSGDVAGATMPLPTSRLTGLDQVDEPDRESVKSRAPTSTPARAVERKLPALIQRPAGVFSVESDELLELDPTAPRSKQKPATADALSAAVQSRSTRIEDSLLRELPHELYAQLLAAEQPSPTPNADDGLIELLAADISAAQVPANQPANAEPIQAPAAQAPVLEIATADDAVAESSESTGAKEMPEPPAATLH